MLADRIKKLLVSRPYWGPQSVAKALGTSPGVIRSTAARERIRFMDRYEVEAYTDQVVQAIEKLGGAARGEAEQLPED